jgi:hypothetical protein
VAIVNGYITLPELKRWLRFDPDELNTPHPDDDLFEAAINGTCRWIDQKCKRHFYQLVEVRDFEATDLYNLALGQFNDLVSVTALTTDDDGDGVYETAWTVGTDFELRPRNVMASSEKKPYRSVRALGRQFPVNVLAGGRLERIRISGTWGWPEFPDGIVSASKLQAARIVKRKEAPEGVLGLGAFGVTVRMGRNDPDVMAAIAPYRLRSLG